MKTNLQVSIIINNYNYERFLPEAIDSALTQTFSGVEVIVVDDGSTDNSREIILNYGNKIIPVFKENGGQASAFNAAFNKSRGDIIFFLDSDDVLYPDAVETVVQFFEAEKIAKVHWPLHIINEKGIRTGEIIPKGELPEGNFREHALHSGPPFFLNPPTSGNAWSREFLATVMPMPEEEFKIGADTYLFETVAFFAKIKKTAEPLSAYRVHGKNNYFNKPFSLKLKSELSFYDKLFGTLEVYCKKLGLHPNKDLWKKKAWFHQVANAVKDMQHYLPDKSTIIFVDDGLWDVGNELEGHRIFPFTEMGGKYFGVPDDDDHAISELEMMCIKGASFLVFAWSSFWWLNEYPAFNNYLSEEFDCICKNERIIIFDLKNTK